MKIRGMLAALAISFMSSEAAIASGLHAPDIPTESHPSQNAGSPIQSLYAPGDPTIGNGHYYIIVFLDQGNPEMRQQIIPLFEFSKSHPNYRIVIKELPLISQESVDVATASTAVALQNDNALWRKFEYQVVTTREQHLTPSILKVFAIQAGISEESYDRAIASGMVLKKLTYNRQMATAAGIHGVPFFVFAPTSATDHGAVKQGILSSETMATVADRQIPQTGP